LPPTLELPAARFGSTIIPHTGSFSICHLLDITASFRSAA
jgi:hypothetical protein